MSNAQQLTLYEGHVSHVGYSGTGRWLIVQTKENRMPVAFEQTGFTGQVPRVGDKISVEASPWKDIWWIGEHRSMVVTPRESFYPVMGLANNEPGRTGFVADLIMRHLSVFKQVSADDIYDEAVAAFPDADQRFLGQGFLYLSKRKLIHRVGLRNSVRAEANHARPVAIWEATKDSAVLKGSESAPTIEKRLKGEPSRTPGEGLNRPSALPPTSEAGT